MWIERRSSVDNCCLNTQNYYHLLKIFAIIIITTMLELLPHSKNFRVKFERSLWVFNTEHRLLHDEVLQT